MNMYWLLAAGSSGGTGARQGSGIGMLFLFFGLFVIWWFLFLRPQIKSQKEKRKMLEALKKGDRVVTRGGLIGTIIGVKEKEQIVVVRVAENVKVEVIRGAVDGVLQQEEVKE
jgi:preprotein translocase subunit YajC